MALDELERFRVVIAIINNKGQLDLTTTLQDVVNQTSLTLAKDWGRRFYNTRMGGPPIIDSGTGQPKDWDVNVTGSEKGQYAMDAHRFTLYANANRADTVPGDVDATRESSKNAADQQTENDLGSPEVPRNGGAQAAGQPAPRQP